MNAGQSLRLICNLASRIRTHHDEVLEIMELRPMIAGEVRAACSRLAMTLSEYQILLPEVCDSFIEFGEKRDLEAAESEDDDSEYV